MNYILAAGMLVLLIISFKISDYDYACPGFLFTACFFLSSVLLMLNTSAWDYVIQPITLYAITSGTVCFLAGCLTRKKFHFIIYSGRYNVNKRTVNKVNKYYHITKRGVAGIFILLGFAAIMVQLLSIFEAAGSMNVFSGLILQTYRDTANAKYTILIKIFLPMLEAVSLIQMIIISEHVISRQRVKLIHIIPILEFFIFTSLSSARIVVIYIFIYIIIIWLFVYRIKTGKKLTLKQLIYICGVILILFFVFFCLGYLTGKSQVQSSIYANISMYGASSIPALDHYLKDFKYNFSEIGTMTFNGIKNILSYLGISIASDLGNEYILLGKMEHTTNVYTCLRPLIHDYNYPGMFLMLYAEGYFFQSVYKKAVNEYKAGKAFWSCFYAYCSAYIVLSSVLDRFFAAFFTLTTAIFILFLIAFSKLIKTSKYI